MGRARAGRPNVTGENGHGPVRGDAERALLLVDVLNDFAHPDGASLRASFRERSPALAQLLAWARDSGMPVVYANDALGEPRCCRHAVLRRALAGPLGDVMASLAPAPGETFLVKPLYSAFEQTSLDVALHRAGVRSLLVAGSATERCVTQTVMGASERDFSCTVVADACPTIDPRLEQIALDYLRHVADAEIAPAARVTACPSSAQFAPSRRRSTGTR